MYSLEQTRALLLWVTHELWDPRFLTEAQMLEFCLMGQLHSPVEKLLRWYKVHILALLVTTKPEMHSPALKGSSQPRLQWGQGLALLFVSILHPS